MSPSSRRVCDGAIRTSAPGRADQGFLRFDGPLSARPFNSPGHDLDSVSFQILAA